MKNCIKNCILWIKITECTRCMMSISVSSWHRGTILRFIITVGMKLYVAYMVEGQQLKYYYLDYQKAYAGLKEVLENPDKELYIFLVFDLL